MDCKKGMLNNWKKDAINQNREKAHNFSLIEGFDYSFDETNNGKVSLGLENDGIETPNQNDDLKNDSFYSLDKKEFLNNDLKELENTDSKTQYIMNSVKDFNKNKENRYYKRNNTKYNNLRINLFHLTVKNLTVRYIDTHSFNINISLLNEFLKEFNKYIEFNDIEYTNIGIEHHIRFYIPFKHSKRAVKYNFYISIENNRKYISITYSYINNNNF